MAYGQGYAGDPRGRESAIEDRQQGRDDVQSQVDSFSSYDLVGNDREGYNWVRVAPTPKQVSRTSPEESFSAKTIAKPIAKPVTKPTPSRIEMYLDDTPALKVEAVPAVKNPFKDLVAETNTEKQSRLNQNAATRQQNALAETSMMAGADYSGVTAANKSAAAAAERERTMGATMGGGPSYDPLRPDPSMPAWGEEWGQESEMTAASSPLTFTNVLRTEQGYKEPVWKPEFSQWSDARKKDWMAGFDKTLGAAGKWSEEMRRIQSEAVSTSVQDMMAKHVNRWYADNEIHGPEYNSVRDVIRHGIATNQFGLTKMTGYETFKSGQEWSDYKNNYAAAKFARSLKPGQNFDDEWAAAVIQEKMNPGSTGLTIDFKAGTENDPTATEALQGWVRSFMDRLSGMQGGGMIAQAEQGGV